MDLFIGKLIPQRYTPQLSPLTHRCTTVLTASISQYSLLHHQRIGLISISPQNMSKLTKISRDFVNLKKKNRLRFVNISLFSFL
ncbi:unnamed protein product [Oikopleura dioica]|uniref:Uncharacterized protein n=1 Tax=Oikopleura dioica TaxID=34765 RepID=E4Y9I3_OIKDI|nr:unnamed protein product [Oikopleura dioica]